MLLGFANVAIIEAEIQRGLYANGTDFLTPTTIPFQRHLSSYEQQLRQIAATQASIPEVSFTTNTILCHVLLLSNKNQEVIDLAKSLSAIAQDGKYSFKYSYIITIKYRAILGTAYESVGMFDAALEVYESAAKMINDSIAASSEALVWAEQFYYRFSLLATSYKWDNSRINLAALRGYQRISELLSKSPDMKKYYSNASGLQRRINILNIHFAYASALVQNNSKEDVDPVTRQEVKNMADQFEQMLFESSEASKSTDSNQPIEQFIETIMTNWRKTVTFSKHLGLVVKPADVAETKRLLLLLRRATIKTFHSCSIARHLVFILAALGQFDEALLAFEVYTDYQEKARIQQAKAVASAGPNAQILENEALAHGDDDKSVVRVFIKAIDILDQVKGDGLKAKETADKLRGWLSNDDDFDAADTSESQIHSREKSGFSLVSADTSGGLATVWAYIARAYCLFGFQAFTQSERDHAFLLATNAFETCVSYTPTDAQVYADYGLFLARTSKIPQSLAVVKQGLIVEGTSYSCWHLMSLLLASMGEYEKALQAITNAIAMMSKNQDSMTSKERASFLQAKLSQIAIVEAINGTERALELIPEAFILFGELFPDSPEKSSKSISAPVTIALSSLKTSSTSDRESLKPVQSRMSIRRLAPGSHFLNRSKSTHVSSTQKRTSLPPLPTSAPNAPTNLKRSATKKGTQGLKANNAFQKKELSSLWLWAAGLYRRAGLFHECEESILESENLTGPTTLSHVELGLLISKRRPLHSMHEFETALELDSNNLEAIVALGQLVLEHSENGKILKAKQRRLKEHIRNKAAREMLLDSPKDSQVFKNPFGTNSEARPSEKIVQYYESEDEIDSLDEDEDNDFEPTHNIPLTSRFVSKTKSSGETSSSSKEKHHNGKAYTHTDDKAPGTEVVLNSYGRARDILFISDADERAAIARVTQLLQANVQSGSGFNSSEAWFTLSQFLELNEDKENAIQALWKSVGLEETRSVRRWTVSKWNI